jgi:hypothetical protein
MCSVPCAKYPYFYSTVVINKVIQANTTREANTVAFIFLIFYTDLTDLGLGYWTHVFK